MFFGRDLARARLLPVHKTSGRRSRRQQLSAEVGYRTIINDGTDFRVRSATETTSPRSSSGIIGDRRRRCPDSVYAALTWRHFGIASLCVRVYFSGSRQREKRSFSPFVENRARISETHLVLTLWISSGYDLARCFSPSLSPSHSFSPPVFASIPFLPPTLALLTSFWHEVSSSDVRPETRLRISF